MRAAVAGLRPLVMTSLRDGERQVVQIVPDDRAVRTHVQQQGPRVDGSVAWYDHRPDGTVWRSDGLPNGGWTVPRQVEWPPPTERSTPGCGWIEEGVDFA